MTYEEARNLAGSISKTGSILGLDSIKNLMQELGNVQEELKIIHIAGTNGKGSVGAYLESVLIEAGKKVGRYTSPAVFEVLEVWKINQRNMPKTEYARIFTQVFTACEKMGKKNLPHPTIFEVETAMAFVYFQEQKCDYVLLEVGMGGETDATNLINAPVCSVLTSINMDHMKFLGGTLAEIATVKAGIIKEGCPVVSVLQKEEAKKCVEAEAKKKHAKLLIANVSDIKKSDCTLEKISYKHPKIGWITTHLAGMYQMENSYLAITVLKEILGIDDETIRKGIEKTVWPGRFEIIAKHPLFLIDGAHNEDAAVKLRATLQNYFTNRKITYIIGVLADKEHEKMLKIMLPFAERVYTVTPDNARAMQGAALAEEAGKYHNDVTCCDTIEEAVLAAENNTPKDGVILAFGSLSYLWKVKDVIKSEYK